MYTSRISFLFVALVMAWLSIAISGCATREYPHPDSVVLQQPRAGESLIYFLRAPHDSGPLTIEVNGKRLAKLPPETYVALSLPPGQYRFLTTSGGLFSNEEVAEPLEVALKENERKYFHVSGNDEKRVALIGVMSAPGAGAVPLLGRESVVRNRMWKECAELDARGLITISRQIEPER